MRTPLAVEAQAVRPMGSTRGLENSSCGRWELSPHPGPVCHGPDQPTASASVRPLESQRAWSPGPSAARGRDPAVCTCARSRLCVWTPAGRASQRLPTVGSSGLSSQARSWRVAWGAPAASAEAEWASAPRTRGVRVASRWLLFPPSHRRLCGLGLRAPRVEVTLAGRDHKWN